MQTPETSNIQIFCFMLHNCKGFLSLKDLIKFHTCFVLLVLFNLIYESVNFIQQAILNFHVII